MAGCDPTIPALGFALSFFGSLPAFSVLFGGFEHETKNESGKGMEPEKHIRTGSMPLRPASGTAQRGGNL